MFFDAESVSAVYSDLTALENDIIVIFSNFSDFQIHREGSKNLENYRYFQNYWSEPKINGRNGFREQKYTI